MSHRGLCGNAAFDEAGWSRRLDHYLFAGATGIPWPPSDDHPELSGDHVETFGDVLAHYMQLAFATRAELVGDVDHLLDARQVSGQRATVSAALASPGITLRRVCRFLAGEALRLHLFGLLQSEEQLVLRQALGPPAEAMALQLLDDLAQPLVLRALGQKHRLERMRIVGKDRGLVGHEADSTMDSSDLATIQRSTRRRRNSHLRVSCTRRQVEAFQQRLQLRRRQPDNAIGNTRPAEFAVLQPLREQAYTRAVEVMVRICDGASPTTIAAVIGALKGAS